MVVFVAVLAAKDFGFELAGEEFDVEELVAEAGVEPTEGRQPAEGSPKGEAQPRQPFAVGVLPRGSGFNIEGGDAGLFDPSLYGTGDELRAVVGPDEGGRASLGDQALEAGHDVLGGERGLDFQA